MSRKNTIILVGFFILYFLFVFVLIPKGVTLFVASTYNNEKTNQIFTHTSSPSPSPTATPEILPTTLVIPSLSLSANIESVGVTADGSMDVPKNAADVAWYQYGPIPGENGNAVIDGHYDTPLGKPAIFYNLKNMQIGNDIKVILSNNSVVDFTVTDTQVIPYVSNPNPDTTYIFSSKQGTNLNLITCDGIWNPVKHNYSSRMIIYASIK